MVSSKSSASEADVKLINNKLMAVKGTNRTSREITLSNLGDAGTSTVSTSKDINILIGDGETVIVSGTVGYSAPITFSGTISSWSLAEVSNTPILGNISIDVLKSDSPSYPSLSSITDINKPSLNNTYTDNSDELDSWNTTLNVGDSIGFKVENNLNCRQIHLIIAVEAGS